MNAEIRSSVLPRLILIFSGIENILREERVNPEADNVEQRMMTRPKRKRGAQLPPSYFRLFIRKTLELRGGRITWMLSAEHGDEEASCIFRLSLPHETMGIRFVLTAAIPSSAPSLEVRQYRDGKREDQLLTEKETYEKVREMIVAFRLAALKAA